MHNDYVWLKIIGGVVATLATLIAYVYGTFETRNHSDEILNHVIRIESKLDTVIMSKFHK